MDWGQAPDYPKVHSNFIATLIMDQDLLIDEFSGMSLEEFRDVFWNKIEANLLFSGNTQKDKSKKKQHAERIPKSAKDVSIYAWNRDFLIESGDLVYLYALTRDLVVNGMKPAMDIGELTEDIGERNALYLQNVIDLLDTHEKLNPSERLARLAVLGEPLFKAMKEASFSPDNSDYFNQETLSGLSSKIHHIVFPCCEPEDFKNGIGFQPKFLAQTLAEKNVYASLGDEPAQIKQKVVAKLLKNHNKEQQLDNIDWQESAIKLSSTEFAKLLIHPTEKGLDLIDNWGFLKVAANFQLYILNMWRIGAAANPVASPKYDAYLLGFNQTLENFIGSTREGLPSLTHDELKSLAKKHAATFKTSLTSTARQHIIHNKCPNTIQQIKTLSDNILSTTEAQIAQRFDSQRALIWIQTDKDYEQQLKDTKDSLNMRGTDANKKLEQFQNLVKECRKRVKAYPAKAATKLTPMEFCIGYLRDDDKNDVFKNLEILQNENVQKILNVLQLIYLMENVKKDPKSVYDIQTVPQVFVKRDIAEIASNAATLFNLARAGEPLSETEYISSIASGITYIKTHEKNIDRLSPKTYQSILSKIDYSQTVIQALRYKQKPKNHDFH